MPPPSTPFLAVRSLSRSASRFLPSTPRIASRFQPQPRFTLPIQTLPKRFQSTTTTSPISKPLTDRTSPSPSTSSHKPPKPTRPPQPEYQITFTCDPCKTRSTHKISKQGYHKGSVLITCPECRNRHVISDHLNIFGDKHFTIEDLMKDKGQLVKKGTLSEDGNVEFWEEEPVLAGEEGRAGEVKAVAGEVGSGKV